MLGSLLLTVKMSAAVEYFKISTEIIKKMCKGHAKTKKHYYLINVFFCIA